MLRVALLGAAALGWAAWLALAPAVAASASSGPAVWAAAATYRAGALICHQQDTRSLHVAGVRMPVCSRCFGLYAGAAVGAAGALAWMVRKRRAPAGQVRLPLTSSRWAVIASGVPTLLAWVGEHVALFAVPDVPRALAAAPLGAAIAVIVALWAGGATFDDAPASALH